MRISDWSSDVCSSDLLRREQRLFAEKVSPEQDLIAARTAATEADIALRLARQQVAAAGGGGGSLNRLAIRAPIAGQVIARPAILGQTVAADAALFRVANPSTRSDEHTSELPPLIRTSYAVFF